MRRIRLLGGAVALALAVAPLTAMTPSSAASNASEASSATTLLSADIGGSILDLDLLTAETVSSLSAENVASALARLSPLTSASSVSVLNASIPPVEVSSGSAVPTLDPIDLGDATAGALPPGVIDGTITPHVLSAGGDADGAAAKIGASVDGLSLVGGLVAVGSIESSVSALSSSTVGDAAHTLSIEELTVLDLAALLNGLGIELTDLSIGVLSDLLGQLGLSLPDLPVGVSLDDSVAILTESITGLEEVLGLLGDVNAASTGRVEAAGIGDLLEDPVGDVDVIDDVVDDALEPLPEVPVEDLDDLIDTDNLTQPLLDLLADLGLDPLTTTVEDVLAAIEDLQATVANLLVTAAEVLDVAPLLTLEDVEVSTVAKATNTVDTSVAQATGRIGAIRIGALDSVGGIDLGDLDLGTITDQINGLLDTVTAAIDEVLSLVDPGLAGIVDVGVFEEFEEVTAGAAGPKATAGISAVTVRVVPPANLAALVDQLAATVGLEDVLSQAGVALPSLDSAMADLADVVGSATGLLAAASNVQAQALDVAALANGLTLRLVTVGSTASFAAAAAPTTPAAPAAPGAPAPSNPTAAPAPTPELPRTGTATLALVALALLLIATGTGLPQWATAAADARRMASR